MVEWHVCLPIDKGGKINSENVFDHVIMCGLDAGVFKRWMRHEIIVHYSGEMAINFYRAKKWYTVHPFYIITKVRAFLRDLKLLWILAGEW